jgi:Flp pilus assembly pilin Flp
MDGRRSSLGFPAVCVAVGGVLAGHWLTYLVVRPDHHDRATLLDSTGHWYLAAAVELALLLALVAAAVVFLGRLSGGGDIPSLGSMVRRLAAFQLGAFVALEVVERAVAGAFDGLIAVCLVGAVMQLVVATTSAWLLRSLARAAESVASVLGRALRPVLRRAVTAIAKGTTLFHPAPAFLPAGIRGPPSVG